MVKFTLLVTGGLIPLRKDIVSTVLKEGMVIGTKLSSCNVWVQNIIYKVKTFSYCCPVNRLSPKYHNVW